MSPPSALTPSKSSYYSCSISLGAKSRERLNKSWAQVQRSTYYKSLDRRSSELKNDDKKAHSSRVLVAEITQK